MPEAFDFDIPSVCAIAPGVLGVTGVETIDIGVRRCEQGEAGSDNCR